MGRQLIVPGGGGEFLKSGLFGLRRFGGDGADGSLVVSGATNLAAGAFTQYTDVTIQTAGVLSIPTSLVKTGMVLLVQGKLEIEGSGVIDVDENGGQLSTAEVFSEQREGCGLGGTGGQNLANDESSIYERPVGTEYYQLNADPGDARLFLQTKGNSVGKAANARLVQYVRAMHPHWLFGYGAGGGGTRGGGFLYIEADEIVVSASGRISADGGSSTSGSGGGGVIILRYRVLTNNGTIRANGGSQNSSGGAGTVLKEKVWPT